LGEPSPAVQPAPSPTITIAEPKAPERSYKPPTLISEEEVKPPTTPQVVTDGQVVIEVVGDRIVPRRVGEQTPANAPISSPAPMTPRRLSKLEAEQEAGRRAVARAMEQQAHRPPPQKSAQEIAAEGTNMPVFRPGDFREYANMRAGNTSKDSGSSVLERVKGSLPET